MKVTYVCGAALTWLTGVEHCRRRRRREACSCETVPCAPGISLTFYHGLFLLVFSVLRGIGNEERTDVFVGPGMEGA